MPSTRNLDVSFQGEREIVLTRAFEAPRELVFDCFTKPELVKRWLFGPADWSLPVCEIDLREGGAIRYVWRHPDKPDMGMSGVFREIARPERIVHTEVFDVDWTGGETRVTTELGEQDGETTVTTTVRYAYREAREGALKTGMTAGISRTYDRLDELLGELARKRK